MTVSSAVWVVVFVAAAGASLGTSALLVHRLEMFAARLGLSEAILGLLSALSANSPEITSAIAALAQGQDDIGVGVVLGSNVFNLAALLGLGSLVAGSIRLHRAAVVLTGAVGGWVALCALVVVGRELAPSWGLLAVVVVLVPYVALAAAPRILNRVPLPARWSGLIRRALVEEEIELAEAVRPRPGTARDAILGAGALVAVVGASVVMERAASVLGAAFGVPTIVVGGLVLAAVTSLPNAVAAVYLALRGRGAAVLSETMNSNTLNVVVGLLVPAALTGVLSVSGAGAHLAAGFAAGLTLLALVIAYLGQGLRRWGGAMLVAGYCGFAAALLAGAR
ncbi:MAG: hypothetical protein J2P38_04545 [Candidatus Dormibacteraeota bacterium]|nr:hypothetical protein [Candidatus Dormibacteraeota bacterium]